MQETSLLQSAECPQEIPCWTSTSCAGATNPSGRTSRRPYPNGAPQPSPGHAEDFSPRGSRRPHRSRSRSPLQLRPSHPNNASNTTQAPSGRRKGRNLRTSRDQSRSSRDPRRRKSFPEESSRSSSPYRRDRGRRDVSRQPPSKQRKVDQHQGNRQPRKRPRVEGNLKQHIQATTIDLHKTFAGYQHQVQEGLNTLTNLCNEILKQMEKTPLRVEIATTKASVFTPNDVPVDKFDQLQIDAEATQPGIAGLSGPEVDTLLMDS